MTWFDGHVISGIEGVAKPDPRIFQIVLDRYALGACADRLRRRLAPQRRSRQSPGHQRRAIHRRRPAAPRAPGPRHARGLSPPRHDTARSRQGPAAFSPERLPGRATHGKVPHLYRKRLNPRRSPMIRRFRGSVPLLAGSVIAAAGLVFGSLTAANALPFSHGPGAVRRSAGGQGQGRGRLRPGQRQQRAEPRRARGPDHALLRLGQRHLPGGRQGDRSRRPPATTPSR